MLRDVLEGKVSAERARDVYRVAVAGRRLDAAATEVLTVMSVRVAVDIGGTFTDATLVDEGTGEVSLAKVLTTPADPSEGFMQAVERALATAASLPTRSGSSSTRRRWRRTRSSRGRSRAAASSRPRGSATCSRCAPGAAVPLRHAIREGEAAGPARPGGRGAERLGPAGEVLRPLEDDSVRAAAAILRREAVESVAVCLLHAYVNAEHERRVGAILAEELPGVPISLSAEVAPEFREYLRASTTVINAVVQIGSNASSDRRTARDTGMPAKLLVMQSNGGVFSFEAPRGQPVFLVESGPAAGVIAAAYLGGTLGQRPT